MGHPTQKDLAAARSFAIVQGQNLGWYRSHFRRIDGNEAAMLSAVLKADYARNLCEERVILAAAHVCARLQRCTALANDDAAAEDRLTPEHLHAKPLSI